MAVVPAILIVVSASLGAVIAGVALGSLVIALAILWANAIVRDTRRRAVVDVTSVLPVALLVRDEDRVHNFRCSRCGRRGHNARTCKEAA